MVDSWLLSFMQEGPDGTGKTTQTKHDEEHAAAASAANGGEQKMDVQSGAGVGHIQNSENKLFCLLLMLVVVVLLWAAAAKFARDRLYICICTLSLSESADAFDTV